MQIKVHKITSIIVCFYYMVVKFSSLVTWNENVRKQFTEENVWTEVGELIGLGNTKGLALQHTVTLVLVEVFS